MEGKEKIEFLVTGLRSMGYWKSFDGHNPNVDKIYQIIQNDLISISGHAQYFADEIERERETVQYLPPNVGPRVSYDTDRNRLFDVLAHLPSPETVRVLGNYLDDERDLALVPPHKPGAIDVTGGSPANAALAATALTQMGIRNPPVGKREYISDFREPASRWKAWYEEVKTGKRPFSFVGQKVEYRFKPDGTLDTLAMANPPDDAPKPPPTRDRAKEQPATGPNPPSRTVWPWIIGGTLAVLIAAVWLRLQFWKPNR